MCHANTTKSVNIMCRRWRWLPLVPESVDILFFAGSRPPWAMIGSFLRQRVIIPSRLVELFKAPLKLLLKLTMLIGIGS